MVFRPEQISTSKGTKPPTRERTSSRELYRTADTVGYALDTICAPLSLSLSQPTAITSPINRGKSVGRDITSRPQSSESSSFSTSLAPIAHAPSLPAGTDVVLPRRQSNSRNSSPISIERIGVGEARNYPVLEVTSIRRDHGKKHIAGNNTFSRNSSLPSPSRGTLGTTDMSRRMLGTSLSSPQIPSRVSSASRSNQPFGALKSPFDEIHQRRPPEVAAKDLTRLLENLDVLNSKNSRKMSHTTGQLVGRNTKESLRIPQEPSPANENMQKPQIRPNSKIMTGYTARSSVCPSPDNPPSKNRRPRLLTRATDVLFGPLKRWRKKRTKVKTSANVFVEMRESETEEVYGSGSGSGEFSYAESHNSMSGHSGSRNSTSGYSISRPNFGSYNGHNPSSSISSPTPLSPDEPPLPPEAIDEALAQAFMPWPTQDNEAAGILPPHKIVQQVERGEWEGITVDNIPRRSALWRLIRAQRLWIQSHQELFKLKHPSGLPRDHRTPTTKYVDSGEPLRAIEILVQSILLDHRIINFQSPEARKDFAEQLAWQIYADGWYTNWPELSTEHVELGNILAEANVRVQGRGAKDTKRALSSFIRNQVVTAVLEERDGHTHLAIQKYAKSLDIIDWVNFSLEASPDNELYGRDDTKQRVEGVFEGIFARGVQIRLGHTLIAQYTYFTSDACYSLLRNDFLAALHQESINLFESASALSMSPSTHKDLKLDIYVSDYVYHIANAFFFEGFYAREKGKSILGVGRPSKLGGRSAVGMEDEQSTASAHALVQAALLFPEDEEKRTECFEMALEEILKVGGFRVGEAHALFNDLQNSRATTDSLWNRCVAYKDKEGASETAGIPDDEMFIAKNKRKQDHGDIAIPNTILPEEKPIAAPKSLAVSISLPQTVQSDILNPAAPTVWQSPWRPPLQSLSMSLIDQWFVSLRRFQEKQGTEGSDILSSVKDLRDSPASFWRGSTYHERAKGGVDEGVNVPWANWGMRSVKETKWEDLMKDEDLNKRDKVNVQAEPAGIAWGRPTPWSIVQRISKRKIFAIDLSAFDGEHARS